MQAERPKSDSVRPVNDLLKQDNRDRFSTVNTVPLASSPIFVAAELAYFALNYLCGRPVFSRFFPVFEVRELSPF